jgi:polyphosphate glucokinase
VVLNGKCLSAGNISPKWVGTQIDQLFSEKCNGLPFYVGNDADLAGIAEMTQGAGRGKMGKVIMLTIGTGIGSGFFYNGVLIPNTELGRINGKKGEPVEYYAADSARKREELSLSKWAQRLDYFLNYIDRCFSPDFIILGGGVSKKYFKFSDHLTVDVPIEVAHFANNAGIVGAAMFAHLNHKG